MKTFKFNKYGKEIEFSVGQKVECIYYHEYERWYTKDAYKRSWLSKLIDRPFKPIKLGVIVGDAGIHPYWLAGNDGKEQYLLVRFKEYFLPKPIPISCIKDALEVAEQIKAMLERDKDKIGQKGYSIEAFESLLKNMDNAFKFVGR